MQHAKLHEFVGAAGGSAVRRSVLNALIDRHRHAFIPGACKLDILKDVLVASGVLFQDWAALKRQIESVCPPSLAVRVAARRQELEPGSAEGVQHVRGEAADAGDDGDDDEDDDDGNLLLT